MVGREGAAGGAQHGVDLARGRGLVGRLVGGSLELAGIVAARGFVGDGPAGRGQRNPQQ